MKISIIIPTLNDPLIEEVIQSVIRESTDEMEVIVVGRDEFKQIRSLDAIRFIDTKRPVSAPVARNVGIRASNGEWLFFIDADCIAQPGWVANLSKHLSDGEFVVGGGVTFPIGNYWVLAYNISMFHEFMEHNPAGVKKFLPTLNLAVKREVIERVGLMNESLVRGQDTDWTIRMALAGYSLIFDPNAVVAHHPRRVNLSTVWRYWVSSGFYNSRNRLHYADYYKTPKLLNHPFWVRILSPLIAGYVTGYIFLRSPRLLRYIHTAPAIFLTKIAWLWGASLYLTGSDL